MLSIIPFAISLFSFGSVLLSLLYSSNHSLFILSYLILSYLILSYLISIDRFLLRSSHPPLLSSSTPSSLVSSILLHSHHLSSPFPPLLPLPLSCPFPFLSVVDSHPQTGTVRLDARDRFTKLLRKSLLMCMSRHDQVRGRMCWLNGRERKGGEGRGRGEDRKKKKDLFVAPCLSIHSSHPSLLSAHLPIYFTYLLSLFYSFFSSFFFFSSLPDSIQSH